MNCISNSFQIDLLSEDITKSAQCAKLIQETDGFKSWKMWETFCKRDPSHLPALGACFGHSTIAG